MKLGDHINSTDVAIPRNYADAIARATALPSPEINQLTTLTNRSGVIQSWNGSAWTDLVPLLQSGSHSGISDSGGNCPNFTFPIAFGVAPAVLLQPYQNSGHMITLANYSTTFVTAKIWDPGGAPAAGFSFSFLWFAIGNRIVTA